VTTWAWDLANNRPLGLKVSSYLDDAKDAVALDVRMSQLNDDGTIYASDITLDAPKKQPRCRLASACMEPCDSEVNPWSGLFCKLGNCGKGVKHAYTTRDLGPTQLTPKFRRLTSILQSAGSRRHLMDTFPASGDVRSGAGFNMKPSCEAAKS
jgi:hypothetical protein